jgi:pyruvate dehydrogenase E2 component (dihydrolipoamide acetyltransferase)
MLNEVKIPSMGATMEEGKIVAWRVKEGERIQPGEILLEIETDKSVFEVESPCGGVVRRILAAAGATLPVQSVIALVGEPTDAIPAHYSAPPAAPTAAVAASAAAPQAARGPAAVGSATGAVKISPRARKLAEQLGVDLRNLRGTGPGGRIESADVERVAPGQPRRDAVIPFDPVRLQINRTVVKSKQEIPHFYIGATIDAARLVAFRQRRAAGGQKLSISAILMQAIARGLAAEPALNVAWSEAGYVPRRAMNVGLAIETPKGVMIAVVENVDKRDVADLSAEIEKLAAVVRGTAPGAIKSAPACMTLSNVGMYRADWFIPIIHPGEAAMLGVGSLAERPIAVNGEVAVRATLPVTLCVDHRIADGAAAARFLQAFAAYLEKLE